MWEFEGDPAHNRRFLIIGRGKPEASPPYDSLRLGYRQFAGGYRRRLIACWPLLSDDGVAWVGGVILAEVPHRPAIYALLEHDPVAQPAASHTLHTRHCRFDWRPSGVPPGGCRNGE